MKRPLLTLVTAVSLLLSLLAAVAWAMSYARPLDWHLLGIAHSADLTRLNLEPRSVVSMVSANDAIDARYGYWDAWWVRSHSGRLTLLAQNIDYDRKLRSVYASPPSLIVDVTGAKSARAVVFARVPHSRSWARRLGFAWDADAQHAVQGGDAGGGTVSVRARMIGVPHWFIVLLGLLLPSLWLRVNRRAEEFFTKRTK